MSRKTMRIIASSLAGSIALTAVACSSSPHSTAPAVAQSADAGQAMPFQPDSPSVYVAKVKDILVGLPPSDQEIAAVVGNPNELGALVDGWMMLPQYTQKMLRFFELAFQQTQVTCGRLRRSGVSEADRHQPVHRSRSSRGTRKRASPAR